LTVSGLILWGGWELPESALTNRNIRELPACRLCVAYVLPPDCQRREVDSARVLAAVSLSINILIRHHHSCLHSPILPTTNPPRTISTSSPTKSRLPYLRVPVLIKAEWGSSVGLFKSDDTVEAPSFKPKGKAPAMTCSTISCVFFSKGVAHLPPPDHRPLRTALED
jgi:hypothetical protein